MNLLLDRKKINYYDRITPISFRKYQYEFILDFIINCIDFISHQGDNYLEVTDAEINERINYTGVKNSKLSHIKITTKNNITNTESIFTSFFVPTLIDNSHFYLNGCYYTPCVYLVDYPIAIKKKSIMISSLFNSISLYDYDNSATFTGRNFPLDSFIQLFIDFNNPSYQNYIDLKQLNHKEWDEDNLIELYSKKFSIKKKSKDKIIERIEALFFDNYTFHLYKACYNLDEVNLKNIILKSLELIDSNQDTAFNNLNYKRIVFMEYLLSPFLKRCSALANEVSKGVPKEYLKVDEFFINKYYLTSTNSKDVTGKTILGLSGNFIYDTKNLFSSILQPKATFITPGMLRPPKEVNYIHDSHFRKICPITVSSIDPGESVSLIPDIELNEFGMFDSGD